MNSLWPGALWVCYPNSPTGAVAPLSFLRDAAEFCRKRGILVPKLRRWC